MKSDQEEYQQPTFCHLYKKRKCSIQLVGGKSFGGVSVKLEWELGNTFIEKKI